MLLISNEFRRLSATPRNMNATFRMKKPHAPLVMPGKIIALVKVVKDEQCQISPDKDEQERVEYIIDEIVRHLRRHYHPPKQSGREVRIAVVEACGLMMQNVGVQFPTRKRGKLPAKLQPAAIETLTNDIRKRADNLYRILQDMPIELEMCVFDKSRGFDPFYAKEEFLERLHRLRTITYRKPPLYDQVKESCAEIACFLMCKYSGVPPTGTEDSELQEIARLLYEAVCPSADGTVVNFKRACDRALRRYRPSPGNS
jgi:hypothetical protein